MFSGWVLQLDLPRLPSKHALPGQFGTGSPQTALMGMFANSWVSVQEVREIIQTNTGGKPGDIWADMAWGLMFSRLLERMSGRLREASLQLKIEFRSTCSFFSGTSTASPAGPDEVTGIPGREVSFIDDVVLILLNPDSNATTLDVILAAQIVARTFQEFFFKTIKLVGR